MKYLFFALVLMLAACKKPDEYPIIPAINFNSMFKTDNGQGIDQQLSVVLDFTDGDGDIGYRSSDYTDPTSEYYNNYKASFYKFSSGSWTLVPTGTLMQGRIPYLTPDGKNKTLKGQIQCDFLLAGLTATNDTFRLEVFIYDRALHKSNSITTPAITLKTQ
jgi:hypothetical protein